MDYSTIFNGLAGKKVIVIGDVMLDSYIWGDVKRISPEAPVPVVRVSQTEHRLGGAANVAKNLAALGLQPVLFSIIGTDDAGVQLREVLAKRAISDQRIFASDNCTTTVKLRVLSGNHQMLRIDTDPNSAIPDSMTNTLVQEYQHCLAHESISAVILQDYNKGVLTESVITQLIAYAQDHGVPIFVDPKKQNFSCYAHVQLFKPNFKEFCEGIGKTCDKQNSRELYKLALEYMQEKQISRLMITLSEHGVFIANQSDYVHIPTQVRHVADVSGAGDTVISVAAACIIAGLPDNEVARISNIAAGLACEMPGVVSISKEDLLKKL